MDSTVGDFLAYLIVEQNFGARVISGLRHEMGRTIFGQNVERAAVSMSFGVDNAITLTINPDWWKRVSPHEAFFAMTHEAYHLYLLHLSRGIRQMLFYENQGGKRRGLFSYISAISADLAANSVLCDHFPEFEKDKKYGDFLLPGTGVFKRLKRGLSYEEYLAILFREAENELSALREVIQELIAEEGAGEQQGKDAGADAGADADGGAADQKAEQKPNWLPAKLRRSSGKVYLPKPVTDELREMVKRAYADQKAQQAGSEQRSLEELSSVAYDMEAQIKTSIKKARETHKSRGRMPAGLDDLLEKLTKPPQIPWTKVLRNMVLSTQKTKKKRGIARPNRRHFGSLKFSHFPGKTRDRVFKVVYMIDTSGSMSWRELEMSLDELRGLMRADKNITTTVIEADAAVAKMYEITSDSEVQVKLKGRGGTNFNPAMLAAKKIRPDVAMYFTDGGAPAPAPDSRLSCPFIWVITPQGVIPDEAYGRVLRTVDR